MFKKVFKVHIYRSDDTREEYNVIAKDDLAARRAAIVKDAEDFKAHGEKLPGVEFCEVTLVCEVIG